MSDDATVGIILAKKGSKECTLALDYDDKPLAQVRELASDLAEFYKLGNYLIVESSPKHYHVVYYQDWLDWRQILRIAEGSKCDAKFLEQLKYKGFLRLRIGEKNGYKPKILEEGRTDYSKIPPNPMLKNLWS